MTTIDEETELAVIDTDMSQFFDFGNAAGATSPTPDNGQLLDCPPHTVDE